MKGSVVTRTLKNGQKRYVAMYRDPAGRQHGKAFQRKKEAEQFLVRTVRSVHDGSFTDLRPMLMVHVFDRWISDWLNVQEKLRNLKTSTARVYRKIVDLHFKPAFGQYRSDHLSPDVIGEWVKDLSHRIGEGKMRPKTYNNVITLLGGILKWARRSDQRYLRHDPMEHVQRLPKQQIEREVLEPNELWTLLKTAERFPPNDTLIKLISFTGLRRGEAFGLQWSDLQRNPDGMGGRLYVRRAVVMGGITTPKTASSFRIVDIPQGLVDELYLYRASYPPMEGDWIFRTAKGSYWDPDNWMKRHFLPLVQRAGLRRIGLHTLRHTYVSLLVNQGESIKYVSRQVGHSTIQMTLDVYGHLFKETSTTAMRKLDQRLRTGLLDEDSTVGVNEKLTRLAMPPEKTIEEEVIGGMDKLLKSMNNIEQDVTPLNTVEVVKISS